MGATLWHHSTALFPNPHDALTALQSQFLAEQYDFPAFIQQQLKDTREEVRQIEAEGDPYDLLEMYRDKLALLEEVTAQALPEDPHQRIALMRKLHVDTGEGIGNVLDVESVSTQRRPLAAQVLTDDEVCRFIGTERPSAQQTEAALYGLGNELGRGEAVCFQVYAEGLPSQAIGWCFVGKTSD